MALEDGACLWAGISSSQVAASVLYNRFATLRAVQGRLHLLKGTLGLGCQVVFQSHGFSNHSKTYRHGRHTASETPTPAFLAERRLSITDGDGLIGT